MNRSFRVSRATALAVVVAGAVGGCGEISNTITPAPSTANNLTVELAGPVNAYYVGMYAAQALGYFKQTDINVTFQTPSAGEDPLTMLHQGKVPVAISSEPSVFLTRNQDMPVVAVGALVQRPLSQIPVTLPLSTGHAPTGGTAVSTTPTKKRRDGAGKGKRTTTATTTTATGTTTSRTGTTTTSTQTTTTVIPTPAQVPTGAVWPGTLQTLLAQKAAPTYNALVIVVRKGTIVDHAGLIRRFVQAVARGYRYVKAHPAAAVRELVQANPSLANQTPQLLATVRATLPYFFPSAGPAGVIWGWQSESDWNTFGTWMQNHGLLNNPNAVSDASTNELLQGEGV